MILSRLQNWSGTRVSPIRAPRRRGRSAKGRPAVALTLEELEGRLTPAGPDPLANINHFVIIYQENWSFDGLYGSFPGANGLSNASSQNPSSLVQIDRLTGKPLSDETGTNTFNRSVGSGTVVPNKVPPSPANPGTLNNPPQPLTDSGVVDTRFNVDPNDPTSPLKVNTLRPYDIGPIIPDYEPTGDTVHAFYQERSQIDGGNQDGYVTWTDNPGQTMSHYDATGLPEGLLAQQYTLDDNFFHAAYGGSFLNHQFYVAAAAPVFPNAPASLQPVLDIHGNLALGADGKIIRDGIVTPATVQPGSPFDKHYAINTIYSANLPPDTTDAASGQILLPSQNDSNPWDPTRPYIPTIGDRLVQGNVSWKYYAAGWDLGLLRSPANPANQGKTPSNLPPNPGFQQFIQPLAYYDNFAPWLPDGTRNPLSAAHLQDLTNFYLDLNNGTLPAVSFVKQIMEDDEHPGVATLLRGQQTTANIVHAIQNSSAWKDTAIIITYDENGGRWDHVSPPNANGPWGDGTRVPAIVISPYARRGFVDHEQHDTLSILKTLEQRFGLAPLNALDAQASSLADDFQAVPQVSIGSAYAQPDAYHPGQFTLVVQGTENSDWITVTRGQGGLVVLIAGAGFYYSNSFPQAISRIEIYGQGGDDAIAVAFDIAAVTDIFAGDGNNWLFAGGGPSVLVGGAGHNVVVGGSAPDLLIGGGDSGAVIAGSGPALLVAGTAAYDADAEALQALLAEWSTGTDTYYEKVGHIVAGAAGGENGSYLLNGYTVQSSPNADFVSGSSSAYAQDLVFAQLLGVNAALLYNLAAGDVFIEVWPPPFSYLEFWWLAALDWPRQGAG